MRNLLPTAVFLATLTVASGMLAAATSRAWSAPDPALSRSQARLALALIERLAKDGTGATTVSPASLDQAFAIVGEGADAAMRAAIAEALGFEGGEAQRSLASILAARARLAQNEGDVLQSADRLIVEPGAALSPELVKRLTDIGVPAEEMDLSKAEAIREVNAWVRRLTRGVIPEILSEPLPRPAFVALNALHFKGKWQTPFDAKLTSPAPFTGADGARADARMMHLAEGRRALRTEDRFVAIDLPFADERFSLVVVTTIDRPARAAEFAGLAEWVAGKGFTLRKGDLALPKFALSGRYDLLPTLDDLGLAKARRSPTALAGFGPGATLAGVLQRTAIEVDEEGAEAAAATAVIATRAMRPTEEQPVHMVVDKPFLFALRETESGLILLAGYVGEAPKAR
ncbi:MAG TPA: serpin family protein [Methylocystis sp.]|nr:serpin family protein [Methylocystis sp.]